MAKYDDLISLTNLIRNVFTLLLYIALAVVFVIYGLPILAPLKDKQLTVDKIDVAGVSLSLSDQLNSGDRITATDAGDQKVDLASRQAAMQIDSALGIRVDSFWVYLGRHDAKTDKFRPRIFDIDRIPSANTVLKAQRDVYKRESAPVSIDTSRRWQLGKIVGVVKDNAKVTVIRVDTSFGNDNYWALVK